VYRVQRIYFAKFPKRVTECVLLFFWGGDFFIHSIINENENRRNVKPGTSRWLRTWKLRMIANLWSSCRLRSRPASNNHWSWAISTCRFMGPACHVMTPPFTAAMNSDFSSAVGHCNINKNKIIHPFMNKTANLSKIHPQNNSVFAVIVTMTEFLQRGQQ